MREGYAVQYGTPAVIVEGGETADEVVSFARELGAVFYEEPGRETLVIDLRNDPGRAVGPELYTEDALRRSLRSEDA
jgi:hypothetical protein